MWQIQTRFYFQHNLQIRNGVLRVDWQFHVETCKFNTIWLVEIDKISLSLTS